MVELPDDAIEALITEVQLKFWTRYVGILGPLRQTVKFVAARVRAEALSGSASRDQDFRIAQSEIVGALEDKYGHETAWGYVSKFAAAVRAEAVADERQRLAAIRLLAEAAKATVPHAPYTGVSWQRLLEVLDAPAAGSVPVATPQPDSVAELAKSCGECTEDGLGNCRHGCRERSGPVATPTQPEGGSSCSE